MARRRGQLNGRCNQAAAAAPPSAGRRQQLPATISIQIRHLQNINQSIKLKIKHSSRNGGLIRFDRKFIIHMLLLLLLLLLLLWRLLLLLLLLLLLRVKRWLSFTLWLHCQSCQLRNVSWSWKAFLSLSLSLSLSPSFKYWHIKKKIRNNIKGKSSNRGTTAIWNDSNPKRISAMGNHFEFPNWITINQLLLAGYLRRYLSDLIRFVVAVDANKLPTHTHTHTHTHTKYSSYGEEGWNNNNNNNKMMRRRFDPFLLLLLLFSLITTRFWGRFLEKSGQMAL